MAITRRVAVPVGFTFVVAFLGFGTTSLLLCLVLLSLFRLAFENEGAQLEARIDVGALTAGFTIQKDISILDIDLGLRVLTFLAKHELANEAIKVILELRRFMGSVDDPTIIGWIVVGLGTELEAKVLDNVGSWAAQGCSDVAQVDDDSLDPVALAFNFGLQTLHFVAIERIRNILLWVLMIDS